MGSTAGVDDLQERMGRTGYIFIFCYDTEIFRNGWNFGLIITLFYFSMQNDY